MAEEHFSIESLAVYLHLTPPQVQRLADRGRLPGRKIGGQWRFAGAEIHHWMEERMGLLDDGELAHVEGVLERSAGDAHESLTVVDRLPVEAIELQLPARTRGKVILGMAEVAARTGSLWDPGKMADAVRAREDMQPTALDNGVALLHPRRPLPGILGGAVLALGISPGGIPFGGSGGILTDVFFLICSMDDQGHLQTLARLSRLLAKDHFLDDLRAAEDAAGVHRLVAEHEQEVLS